MSKEESLELGFEIRQRGEILQTGRPSDETERALGKKISNYVLEFSKASRLTIGRCVKFDVCRSSNTEWKEG